jgi:hypothetical protein
MNVAVEGYHCNGDSPMSGQDYVGESDSEPPQEEEDCGDENHEDEGSNVSGDQSHVNFAYCFDLVHIKLLYCDLASISVVDWVY